MHAHPWRSNDTPRDLGCCTPGPTHGIARKCPWGPGLSHPCAIARTPVRNPIKLFRTVFCVAQECDSPTLWVRPALCVRPDTLRYCCHFEAMVGCGLIDMQHTFRLYLRDHITHRLRRLSVEAACCRVGMAEFCNSTSWTTAAAVCHRCTRPTHIAYSSSSSSSSIITQQVGVHTVSCVSLLVGRCVYRRKVCLSSDSYVDRTPQHANDRSGWWCRTLPMNDEHLPLQTP